MFEERVRPYLQRLEPGILYSRTVKICGMGESKVASIVQDLIDSQTNPTIAPYAKTGEVHLRVTARAQAEKEAKNLVKPMVKELEKRFGKDIYTTREDVALEQAVVDLLLNRQLTVCTIESCTGGMLAARLINVPGVSETFRAGFITYSNKAKQIRSREPADRGRDGAWGGENVPRGCDRFRNGNRRPGRRKQGEARGVGLYRLSYRRSDHGTGISFRGQPGKNP